jgi:hypothetical protein
MDSNKIDTGIPGFSLDNLMEGYQLISYDWRYMYVNKAVIKHSKYASAKDLIGFTMMEKFPGIENTRLFEILQQCMNDRIATVMENEFTFPDGSVGIFDLRIEPVPQGLFILSVDVTERKKKEREKTRYIASLEHMLKVTSQRVEEPLRELYHISDNLNTKTAECDQLKDLAKHIRASAAQLDSCRNEIETMISSQGMA